MRLDCATRVWSSKDLESTKDSLFFVILKQFFDFPERWSTFFCVCVTSSLEMLLFVLLCFDVFFCYSLFSVWLSAFGLLFLVFACVILISSNGNICYSLFTLIVTLCFAVCLFCVFSVFSLIWKHFTFSRECWTLINGCKWRRWKLWYASCCFSFYFPCVLLGNLTITSSGHFALSLFCFNVWFSFVAFRDTLV